MDLSVITLIIPTHNRANYLSRILDYYSALDLNIIIVDSTPLSYQGGLKAKVQYYHLPGMPMPQKLKFALEKTETKWMVFCADDDFIIPEALPACIQFLENSPDYASAQGNSITYRKREKYTDFIEFNLLYENNNNDINGALPEERLMKMFSGYRTIFSAVHYTKHMRFAFSNLDPKISNLFLNEYLTAIIPIVAGKHRELPLFYQVREYTEVSGDKTTDNLDIIYVDPKYREELDLFLDFEAGKIMQLTGKPFENCRGELDLVLKGFAEDLARQKQKASVSFTKFAGSVISRIPFIGEKIVMQRRLKEQRLKWGSVVRSGLEMQQLEAVKKYIFKHGEAVA